MAIPQQTKLRLQNDIFMTKCCVADDDCGGRIEWNHALIYGGRRVQEWWSILPMCSYHHANTDRKDIRKKINAIMRERSGGEIEKYEKIRKFL
jgi:hypothetical protein